jgi:GNAT superfamily N-acetyltransferase
MASPNNTTNLMVRLDDKSKAFIAKAAKLGRVSMSDYFRLVTVSQAQREVDNWLTTKAMQHRNKHLSVTRVLLNEAQAIAGFFTLATGQINFCDLPADVTKRMPRRTLPVAALAWLGTDRRFQGQGLGKRLLAQALRDRHMAGHPYRLFLSSQSLDAMMQVD